MRLLRIHKEGKSAVIKIGIVLIIINGVFLYILPNTIFTAILLGLSLLLYAMALNFYRHPNRTYKGDLHGLVNAPTDGKVVVIEKVFEKEFFNDERIQVSIFMSFFNAHSTGYRSQARSSISPMSMGIFMQHTCLNQAMKTSIPIF